jgi:hypothetical protein
VLGLDEELRKRDPTAPLESEDVVSHYQPELAAFLRGKVEETARVHKDDVDLDQVDAVYRLALVEVLAFSYAFPAPAGWQERPAGLAS